MIMYSVFRIKRIGYYQIPQIASLFTILIIQYLIYGINYLQSFFSAKFNEKRNKIADASRSQQNTESSEEAD